MKTITIYSTPTCHFCHMAKDFLKEHNIAFTDIDVSADIEKKKEIMEMTGQLGVPVIVVQEEEDVMDADGNSVRKKIGDPVIMVGFNERLLSETLQIAA